MEERMEIIKMNCTNEYMYVCMYVYIYIYKIYIYIYIYIYNMYNTVNCIKRGTV